MKVLFITPYPNDTAPSQRFRFEQYFNLLKENNVQYTQEAFINYKTWEILYAKGKYFQKSAGILEGFTRRFILLFRLNRYDRIFIHREAAPIGPPLFEWLIGKIFLGKIIYDFDDAIWLPNTSGSNRLISSLKWHGKVKNICGWVDVVSCGNEYLCEYASKYNRNVQLNPTTVDTNNYHYQIRNQKTEEIVIGWTGSHSTIKYLEFILPIIEDLQKEHEFTFQVISDLKPTFELKSFKFIKWDKKNEINELLNLNIGIMPLTEDQWSKGKCGFKLLQYMSLGIPPVASPVGVNTKIIDDQVNGYLCKTAEQWKDALSKLIISVQLRTSMGAAARKKIEDHFSVVSNAGNFLSLFA